MHNTITIWRPFQDIEKSVNALSIEDLVKMKVDCSMVIKSFLAELGLIDEDTKDYTAKNQSIAWYWNDGNPFLYDLIWFYSLASKRWTKEGGEKLDHLKDYWDIIYSTPIWENESDWQESQSNIHKFILLERNWFWYKRFMIQHKDLRLISKQMYTENGLPRKLEDSEIYAETYESRQNKS